MTLRLILIRHAKSSWDEPGLDDHERPLSARGRRSAQAIGEWLAEREYLPDLVLSSDSVRTRETWALMAPGLRSPITRWEPALYLAGPGAMLKMLRTAGDTGNVAILGHNPGIAHFASAIVAVPPSHGRFSDYPTGATLIADFDAAAWPEITPGSATVVDFVVPRDLTD
ncbi:histidine phosphatase family protein [Pseudoruegeria sp. HB172150]|uniref:SixA phosphatase family protein n=1 Tax=Pseudoruegeria sp. HB172150 TaxID=2721164 RepID=UPI0015517B20|nr:histidine phosphatase family protein [Pseudoruegeria sp. HB172150]